MGNTKLCHLPTQWPGGFGVSNFCFPFVLLQISSRQSNTLFEKLIQRFGHVVISVPKMQEMQKWEAHRCLENAVITFNTEMTRYSQCLRKPHGRLCLRSAWYAARIFPFQMTSCILSRHVPDHARVVYYTMKGQWRGARGLCVDMGLCRPFPVLLLGILGFPHHDSRYLPMSLGSWAPCLLAYAFNHLSSF